MSRFAIQTRQWMAIGTSPYLCLSLLRCDLHCRPCTLGLLFRLRRGRRIGVSYGHRLRYKAQESTMLLQVYRRNPVLLTFLHTIRSFWGNLSHDRSDCRCSSWGNSNNTNDALHYIFWCKTDLLEMQTTEMRNGKMAITSIILVSKNFRIYEE